MSNHKENMKSDAKEMTDEEVKAAVIRLARTSSERTAKTCVPSGAKPELRPKYLCPTCTAVLLVVNAWLPLHGEYLICPKCNDTFEEGDPGLKGDH